MARVLLYMSALTLFFHGHQNWFSPTISAFIRFVSTLLPSGTPAVMTTVSPAWTSPSFRATSVQREKIRSVECTSPVRNGTTPQLMASWRRTFSRMVNAAMGQAGRKREIIRVVCPELVVVRIAVAFYDVYKIYRHILKRNNACCIINFNFLESLLVLQI